MSILVISIILFLYISNENKQQRSVEKSSPISSTRKNTSSSVTSLVEKTSSTFNPKELEGDYLNHVYIRKTPELSDAILSLNYNDNNELEAHYIYYEPIGREDNGEEWGVQRYGESTTLTPISDTVFIIDHMIEPFTDNFLYIIKTENQIGLSLDGKEIDFYKHQYIIPKLSDDLLIKHFYGEEFIEEPSNIDGHSVIVGRIEHFKEFGNEYTLVFFEEYFNELYGLRSGGNSSYLSVAKLQKETTGMRVLSFSSYCACGRHTMGQPGSNGDSFIAYPTLQKIGNRHFLLRNKTVLEESTEKTLLQIYDLQNFEEILSVDLEAYKTNYQGEKTYTLKNTFLLAEDDCAIIIQQTPISREGNNFKRKQDIYLFEENSNTFVKSNLDS